jgi:UDP-glucose 4-epimerase
MRVLVTGGAGFIGSHVADALLERGHEVLVADNFATGQRANVPAHAQLAEVDITTGELDAAVARFRPEAVVHHAAQMDVRRSVAEPTFDAETNVIGTVRVAAAAASVGARALIFASSGGAIYGEQETFPAPESHLLRPVSPYGVAKLCGESYVDYYGRAAGMRTVCLRYANVYGPRQNGRGEAGVVAIFSSLLLAGKTPTIYGDGKQTRDYVYVGDVVRANLAVLADDRASGPYNVATGLETDVVTLAQRLARAAGVSPTRPQFAAARAGEQRRSVLDCSRAMRELGWRAEVDLDTGLARTAASMHALVG